MLRLPLTIIKDHLVDPFKSPLLPSPTPALAGLVSLEFSGSCMTTATIDVANDKLYVANVGDCRAVAGWWDPKEEKWRCDVISEVGDCNGDNAPEAERIRKLHPESEWDDVVCDLGDTARVLGNSQITRAMGASCNKRQINDMAEMTKAFGIKYSKQKKPYLTPPYVRCDPEVLYRDLHPESGEVLKFLIIATDGLWDRLTSEEATLLISAQTDDPSCRMVTKDTLPLQYPYKSPQDVLRPYPAEELPGTTAENSEGSWTFGDDNSALHLVRNCLGDDYERQHLLSLKNRLMRAFRDDITVVVVHFDEPEKPIGLTELDM